MIKFNQVKIRVLDENDLDAVVEIDKRILGQERHSYWKRKMAYAGIYPRPALVAEVEGKIVGFILGFVSGWEFCVPDTVGWIETIGVDPDFQRRGIGKALFQALINIFRKSGSQKTLETDKQEVEGVNIVYTLASWNDWDMLQFYHAMGLKKGEMESLEMKLR